MNTIKTSEELSYNRHWGQLNTLDRFSLRRVLDAGPFALNTAADEIGDLVRRFLSNKQ